MRFLPRSAPLVSLALALSCAGSAFGAGILTPKGSPTAAIQIREHHLAVIIQNGFARSEVNQTFFNPNDADFEAIYSFPLPKSASLSEVTIYAGEQEIHGEVLPAKEAQRVYEEERYTGNDAGLARKQGYQSFEFLVGPVRAKAETRVRFVYYQPLEIDTGVGRYLYPLAEGGTDDAGASFWERNDKVEGTFSARIELKSAWPVTEVRLPGREAAAKVEKLADGHYKASLESQADTLGRDLVFYYRLQDDLPGRVDLIPYRAAADKPGTFMLVVTPGIDLQPIRNGADYVFVLDVSGSMSGKIATLTQGVVRTLKELQPQDRFRIVTFSTSAEDLTSGFVAATKESVEIAAQKVEALTPRSGTNLYAGIARGLQGLDADRATSLILVTDGVANTGEVSPQAFRKLMKSHDIRAFGFLMGNSANWPLMRTICEASGGFYASVSNDDDIIGQILLAKSKIRHECLHDAALKVRGVKISDTTDEMVGKVFRGQQLVFFGRYASGGTANVTLSARLTGEDRTYSASFAFPDIDTENPEVERLWALSRVEAIEALEGRGNLPAEEARQAVQDLGVAYQLVTDHTSMVVLADEAFARRGIERRNQSRVAVERQAQTARAGQPIRNRRVDEAQPAFPSRAPSLGGGAIDPLGFLLALGVAGLGAGLTIRRRKEDK